MKFNCGPSAEERAAARQQVKEERWKKALTEGEIVFAFLPKRTANSQCVWLEKVKRTAVGYRYGCYRYEMENIFWALARNGATPIWKYEALDNV